MKKKIANSLMDALVHYKAVYKDKTAQLFDAHARIKILEAENAELKKKTRETTYLLRFGEQDINGDIFMPGSVSLSKKIPPFCKCFLSERCLQTDVQCSGDCLLEVDREFNKQFQNPPEANNDDLRDLPF